MPHSGCSALHEVNPNLNKRTVYKHKNSFRYESKKNATEISHFEWENKHTHTETSLDWKILNKAKSYEPR